MTSTIDASVVCAAIFEEPLTLKAEVALACSGKMIAPSIIDAELLSAATKRARGGMRPEDARSRMRHAGSLDIERLRIGAYADDAFDLSVALRHPSADCLYLAVAIREQAPLITGDRRLYDRAVVAGLGEHVRWLGDF